MKIAVLDYSSAAVDILTVEEELIDTLFHGDVEDFLRTYYNLNEISWMADVKEVNVNLEIFDGTISSRKQSRKNR